MTKPKILIPQPLPAIFEQARDEANWLIFAVGKPDENGKRPKRPVAPGRPYVPIGREKAACMTYDKAVQRLQEFATMFGTLEEIDAKHKAYIEDRKKEGKTPGKAMDYDMFVLGYFAREDSALVALDFDNSVADGLVYDFELAGVIEDSEAYIEISSSGTGLRVLMPREWGDDMWPTGEKNDVGLMGNGNGAAFALTFYALLADGEKKAGRDDNLVQLALDRRGVQSVNEGEGTTDEVADQVLDHGRIEVDTFVGEMVPLIENDERFDEFDDWFGMIRAAREYYEVVDPDRLDEVREAVEAWCESWEGGDHDAEKFEDVWNRKARKGAKASLGSWVHHAQEAGFKFDKEATVDPETGELPEPVETVTTRREAYERFALVNDSFYDRHERRMLDRGNAGLVNSIARAFVQKTEKGTAPMSADKIITMMRHNALQFSAAKFLPGKPPVDGTVLNLWEPLRQDYPSGDVSPWFEHIVHLFGRDGAEKLADFMAFTLQNPGQKPGWAPMLIGPPRCGKDTIIGPWVKAFDRYADDNVSLERLEKEHNGWIETKLLMVMQEAVAGRMSKANIAEKLKPYIAAPPETLPLRKMGKDYSDIPNVVNVIFLSNHLDGVFVEQDNKDRYFPMVTTKKPDQEYFRDLHAWLDKGGSEKVVGFLLARKVKWAENRGRAPESEHLETIVRASLPEGALDVLDYVSDKRWLSTKHLKSALSDREFGSSPGWRMADKALAATLTAAGFVKPWDRVTVRDGEVVSHHRIWVRQEAFPLSEEIVTQALKQGGDKLAQSQAFPLEGGTEDERGNVRKIK